jgi:hypothetical protein
MNSIGEAGRRSEKRVAGSLGARLHPASGSMRGAKSDASMKNFRLEMKSSSSKTIKLEMGWLVKISQEARCQGQIPALVFSFTDGEGKLVQSTDAEWVCIPISNFKELVGD